MRKFLSILLCVFALCTTARASVLNLQINSANFYDGHEYIGPYQSTLTIDNGNGSFQSFSLQTFCIDFESTVGFGQEFRVNVVSLDHFAGPLKQDYWEAAWLALQLQNTTDQAVQSLIQRAMWLVTTPGTDNQYLLSDPNVFAWTSAAYQNYQTVDPQDVTLYLKDGNVGQNQISVVPEPSTYATIMVAFGALVGLRRYARS